MKLVTVDEMQRIEKAADKGGHTYEAMMEQAGLGLAEVVHNRRGELDDRKAMGLVGSGNNGGDTLVALSHLAEAYGWETTAYLVKERAKDDPMVARLKEVGGDVVEQKQDKGLARLKNSLASHTLLLDGVLGTGVQLPLKGEVLKVLQAVNSALSELRDPPFIVAVDCPSGMDCDTGAAAPECLRAQLTVSMAAIKAGMLRFPAFEHVGQVVTVDIGLPATLKSWKSVQRQVADAALVRSLLPARPRDAHKGTFGTAMVVGGSINYTGAVLLAGRAAYLSGAGLVHLAVPAPLHTPLAGQLPEAIWLLLPHELGVISNKAVRLVADSLGTASALAIGPGIGTEDTTGSFLAELMGVVRRPGRAGIGFIGASPPDDAGEHPTLPPTVVDADGLKLLAELPDWEKYLPAPAVLTPHPGEMAALTGLEKDAIQADRLQVAEKYASAWGHVVVLKGALTVIAAPDGPSTVIPVANPALARAGTGDVLTGLIAGLMAQGLEPYPAAVAGAWIHAQAGVIASELIGNTASVLAGDVLEAVVDVITALS